jgi:oxygen-independent coproporphyrinogen-3 oxidase
LEETLDMYRTARDFLVARGYRQVTTYDWERVGSAAPRLLYEDELRHRFTTGPAGTLTGSQTWGWGFSGISHFLGNRSTPGWTYMNHTHVEDYFKALDAGQFPVERAFHYAHGADFRLTVLFQMLVSMAVDRVLYSSVTGMDVVAEFADVWETLAECGWVSITPERLELSGDGVFYTPLIQSLLARDRIDDLRKTTFANGGATPTAHDRGNGQAWSAA